MTPSFPPPSKRQQLLTVASRASIPLQPHLPPSLRSSAHRGLSASGRRSLAANTTPHARAAYRTIDARRAAALTPGKNKRRESFRPRRESLHDVLRGLSRVIDENATIEFPRRAYTDQVSRMSMGSVRLSEYRNYDDLDDDNDEGGEGFFPGFEVGALDEESGRDREESFGRDEEENLRRQTMASARASDFGFEVPVDADNQTTFVMAVEGQSSPARPLPEVTDEQPSLNITPAYDESVFDELNPPMDEDMGFGGAYDDLRSSTPIEPAEATELDDDETKASAHFEQQQQQRSRKTKRGVKLSRYNVEYPSLPPAVVKRLANTFARSSGISKTKISPEALAEIQRASDWFFEQLGDDLSAYARHAKRKTIDESDMLTLMRRYLPRELLQELRMPKPPPPAEPRRKRHRVTDGDDGEEG
ncbi:hypothetical protein ColKHC_12720 [Colletotrichum higginsianum]|nr:hypothetical protein ColKHC_12720 [Colletotrichum higginsianum]